MKQRTQYRAKHRVFELFTRAKTEIYWTVIKNRNNLISYNLTFKLIGFGVPMIFAIIPLVTNCYGS